MEFIYTVDPSAQVPIMLLNDDIGFDPETGKGIDGGKFMAELMALDAMRPKSIEIWINSCGGVVIDGYNIYSGILRSKTPVDTVGVGCMASIAAVIFQAGRNRTMMDFSWLMYHNAHGGDDKKVLDTMDSSIGKMVARSGKSEDEIRKIMKKETYITADEALEYGFTDRVEASADHNKKRMSSFSTPEAFQKEAKKIVNKLLTNKKIPNSMSFKLVTNKLGLNEDATEDNILKAIEKIQNKAKADMDTFEDKMTKLQKAKDDLDEEMNTLKKEKTDMEAAANKLKGEKVEVENKLKTMTDEKEAAEDLALTEKAKNMVEGFAKIGRIKNEAKTIDFWTELAKANKGAGFDIVKDQIEALPLNKTAPVIHVTNADATAKKYTMGVAMLEIANKQKQTN